MGSFSADVEEDRRTRPARRGVGRARGMAARRGLGFDRNDSVFNSANSIISQAQSFVDSESPVPSEDRKKARETISEVNRLLQSLGGVRNNLSNIATSGRYTSSQRNSAKDLIGQIDSVSTKLQDEKQRANRFLDRTPEPSSPIDIPDLPAEPPPTRL